MNKESARIHALAEVSMKQVRFSNTMEGEEQSLYCMCSFRPIRRPCYFLKMVYVAGKTNYVMERNSMSLVQHQLLGYVSPLNAKLLCENIIRLLFFLVLVSMSVRVISSV